MLKRMLSIVFAFLIVSASVAPAAFAQFHVPQNNGGQQNGQLEFRILGSAPVAPPQLDPAQQQEYEPRNYSPVVRLVGAPEPLGRPGWVYMKTSLPASECIGRAPYCWVPASADALIGKNGAGQMFFMGTPDGRLIACRNHVLAVAFLMEAPVNKESLTLRQPAAPAVVLQQQQQQSTVVQPPTPPSIQYEDRYPECRDGEYWDTRDRGCVKVSRGPSVWQQVATHGLAVLGGYAAGRWHGSRNCRNCPPVVQEKSKSKGCPFGTVWDDGAQACIVKIETRGSGQPNRDGGSLFNSIAGNILGGNNRGYVNQQPARRRDQRTLDNYGYEEESYGQRRRRGGQ